MVKFHQRSQKIDTVIVMLLFVLFGVTTFVLILIGVKQYKQSANAMSNNYQIRTTTSYLVEKVRQNDNGSGIFIKDIDGTQALALSSNINETEYYTYIYYYKGSLRELFVSADAVYSLSSGQAIVELTDFTLEDAGNGLVRAHIKAGDNLETTLFLGSKTTN